MLYFLSNSDKINQNILNKINFKNTDKIIIFNRRNDHIIKLILNFLDKKYDFKIQVIWCQRTTARDPVYGGKKYKSLYRGFSSPYINNKRFNNFYLIGGAKRLKNKIGKLVSHDDPDILESTINEFNTYKKILQKNNDKRNVKFINCKSMVKPYGSGYQLFNIKNYEPYTGFLMIMYFDKLFPNEDKTLIGFNCYQDKDIFIKRNKTRNKDFPGHRDILDYNLLKSYCIERNINFKFSKLNNKKNLVDDIFDNYIPLFKLKNLIDIENPVNNTILKCKDFDERIDKYINLY